MLNRDPADYQTLHEFVHSARGKLDQNIWDYLIGGASTETTVRRNRLALDRIALRPRVLRNVSQVDARQPFLGHDLRLPLAFSPVGSLDSFHPHGAQEAVKAAAEFGIAAFSNALHRPGLEAIAAIGDGPRILQCYAHGDREWLVDVAQRAAAAGFDALCLTVDNAVGSRRERDIAKRFVKPWGGEARQRGEISHVAALDWDDLHTLRQRVDLPIALKGIATAEDARLAAESGVDIVYVSNHGGRQLDHGRGSIDVLPEVVAAVQGRSRIVIDGGFSRGTDIVKAIALGADLVSVGRLYCYALAVGGAGAVVRLLQILESEVLEVLALLGVTRLNELNPAYLYLDAPVTQLPDVHSAFPLLNHY